MKVYVSILIVIVSTISIYRKLFLAVSIAMTHPYARELEVATLAVKRASFLTKKLSDSIATTQKSGTQIKDDKSPVTIGDYAAQAIINNAIKKNFPNDEIIGEEDSESLQNEESKPLTSQILQTILDVQKETPEFDADIGSLTEIDLIFKSIDLGQSEGGSTGRIWALDPIDGTKGFLRGDQFAVCLALIENGKVVFGIIGCPNLPATIKSNTETSGVVGGLYSAIKGQGAYYTELFEKKVVPLSKQTRLQMKQNTNPDDLIVAEGVEKGHSSHSTQSQIKRRIGFNDDTVAKQTINLDSQVKYCVLALGQADIYLRLPINDTYREKIWDHAAGNILIYEAGGQVGDITGAPLDFGKGRLLQSKGVIAGSKAVFDEVISAVKNVLN